MQYLVLNFSFWINYYTNTGTQRLQHLNGFIFKLCSGSCLHVHWRNPSRCSGPIWTGRAGRETSWIPSCLHVRKTTVSKQQREYWTKEAKRNKWWSLPVKFSGSLFLFETIRLLIKVNLTSISHQQLLRGGMPVRVLVLSWSNDIDAVGTF